MSLYGCGKDEWDGFVYPDRRDLTNDIYIGTFNSLENCRSSALGLINSDRERFLNPDYECGKNCDTSTGKPYICKETLR